MPFAFIVSTNTNVTSGSAGGTTPGVDTTGADLIVLHVAYFPGGNPNPPTDSNSNTWIAGTAIEGSEAGTVMYYVISPTVGSGHTFTIAGATSFSNLTMVAYSGVDTSDGFEAENQNAGGGGATSTVTGSVTPANNDSLIIFGWAGDGDGQTATVDIGTAREQDIKDSGVDYNNQIATFVQGTAAAIEATWSHTSSPGETYGSIIVFNVGDISTVDLLAFQWREDDGSESGASNIGAQNEDLEIDTVNRRRLRILLDAVGDPPDQPYKLRYKQIGDPDSEYQDP